MKKWARKQRDERKRGNGKANLKGKISECSYDRNNTIVSPCKLSAIDDRIRNFTQQHYILQVVYALSKFSQAIGLL